MTKEYSKAVPDRSMISRSAEQTGSRGGNSRQGRAGQLSRQLDQRSGNIFCHMEKILQRVIKNLFQARNGQDLDQDRQIPDPGFISGTS